MQFTNYRKAVDYLIHVIPKTNRRVFDDDEAIKKNYRIMELLGNPQEAHPAIHVAGTSGKGTICYLVDAILRAHSKRTGMTQSPHVYDIRERIQINGQLVSEKYFTQLLSHVLNNLESNNVQPSYFETLIAMAYSAFREKSLDYTIIETGFGGRLDATNVIRQPNKVCVLGQIGFDHTAILGNTLAKIAKEKAGIIQQNSLVIALRQTEEVNAVFEARCREMNASLQWVEQTGDYQKTNDAIAKTVCKLVAQRDGWQFDDELVDAVLQQVFIPGRFEKRHYKDHLLILDGAHNPQKLAAFAGRVAREHKAPITLILALGERKDLKECLQAVQPVTKRIIATEYFTNEKDIPVHPHNAAEIVETCKILGIEAHIHTSPARALRTAADFPEPIAASGSFYILSEIDAEVQK